MPRPWKHRRVYWLRVPRSDERRIKVSTGTTDKRTANGMGAMVDALHARGERSLLDAVCDRKQPLLALWAEWAKDSGLATTKQSLDDADLEPYIAKWREHLVQNGVASADRYVSHVRQLIPEGKAFPRSRFRRKVISEHLGSLQVSPSTRNRHRSALLQFGRFLVEREVLETNPVRDVASSTENGPRNVFYSMADAKRVIEAQPLPYKALGALMASTGMERQAAQRLRLRDLDLDRGLVHARGSKTKWRNRTCAITQPWATPILRQQIRGLTPDALVFPGLDRDGTYKQYLAAHHAACAAVQLSDSVLHDWRHTFAVDALRRKVKPIIVASQLGHANATLVLKTYGHHVPDIDELLQSVA